MYRLVDCGTWDDSWFASLKPDAKLFFLYLLTNRRTTSCGAYEVTIEQMVFETKLPTRSIERWLAEWAPRVQWWPEHSIIWIKNFYGRQTNSEKIRINARKLVAKLPPAVRDTVCMTYPELGSPTDTLSLPHASPIDKVGINRTATTTERNGDKTATATAPARAADLPAVTTRPMNGQVPCAFAAAVGEESFRTIAENFASVNVQLDRHWLERTVAKYEAQGLSLPPPRVKQALKTAFLKSQDALGREGNRIQNPPAWAAKQIETALRDEAGKT